MCQLDCNGDHRLFLMRVDNHEPSYHVGLSKIRNRYKLFADQLNAGEKLKLTLPISIVEIERLA